MKKIVAVLMVLAMALGCFACTQAPTAEQIDAAAQQVQDAVGQVAEAAKEEVEKVEEAAAPEALAINIAMVTDVGNIDDQSFNEFTWKGCKEWAEANGAVANYYRPTEDSDEARTEAIKTAIEKGANVIVCPGFLFGAVYQSLPQQYPEVMFLGIDLGLGDVPEPTANTALITYQEEQAGYFAGYAAVKDGYTKLAFLGGIDVPAVIRYGHGYVQGANEAAVEMGNTADVSITYWYSGSFVANDEIKAKTAGWYTDGVQVIFACGGGIVNSALASAEEADAKVIGVDVDQGYISERIITSAMKDIKGSTMYALDALKENNGAWPEKYAATENKIGAAEGSVGLPTADGSWRLSTFTVDEYNAIFEKVKSGELAISSDIEAHPADIAIKVDYQND